MLKWILLIIIGIIFGVASAFFQIPAIYFISFFILAVIVYLFYVFYIVAKSKNIRAIKNYVKRQKKDPQMRYIMAVVAGTKADEIAALDTVIAENKNEKVRLTYEMNRAIRLENYQLANEKADLLQSTTQGQYAKALIAALQGRRKQALQYDLSEKWMEHAIAAEFAYRERNLEKFKENAALSVTYAKGIQRLLNYYSFQKAEQEQKWKS